MFIFCFALVSQVALAQIALLQPVWADDSNVVAQQVGSSTTPRPGRKTHKIKIDKRKRHYVTYVPKSITPGPKPLVVVMHGALCNAGMIEWTCKMSNQAEKDNFIVAYPEGTGPVYRGLLTWNAGSCCGTASKSKINDIKFLRAMIDEIEQQFDIDKNRIYLAGVSNGGMMAYRAASELSDVVAAIASVEGCMLTKCTASQPVSVVAFHGTEDSIIPYNGGTGRWLGFYPVHTTKVSDTIETWVKHNQCSNTIVSEQIDTVTKEEYTGGTNGSAVCLYTLKGGRHAWPGGRFPSKLGFPLMDSKVPNGFSATEEMCKFFWEHPKKNI
jgi:Poly(3-hydroxybutyrate) depolymerase